MTPRRTMIIGGVAMLHAAAIYALITGMAGSAIKTIETVIQLTPVETPHEPPKPTPLPPTPQLQQPTVQQEPVAVVPEITIASETPAQITTVAPPPNPPTAIADSGASGVTNTHTTPPYPPLANKMSHQGTVLLQIVVTAQGDVASATVATSSGFEELDQAAVAWVVAHWKYKAAIQNGLPVASQTSAMVKFDLKLARR
jgi:protein TonB